MLSCRMLRRAYWRVSEERSAHISEYHKELNLYCIFGIFTLTYADPSGRAVYGRSPAEIVGSNFTGGMEVCLLWVLCVVG